MSQAARAGTRPDRSDAVGLLAGTRIMTAEGALPVEWLAPGDRVIARNGMRRLEAVDWRAEADAPVGCGRLYLILRVVDES